MKITLINELIVLILIVLISCKTQKIEKTSSKIIQTEIYPCKVDSFKFDNILIKASEYQGVIFSDEYDWFGLYGKSKIKFMPSISEIDSVEMILRKGIKKANKLRMNQSDNCPIIDENLSKYIRQYFGQIVNGQKVVFVNCFWAAKGDLDYFFSKESNKYRWKAEMESFCDGCSYHWSIMVNLKTKKLYDLSVNGLG